MRLRAIWRPPAAARFSGTVTCPHIAPDGCCLSAGQGRSEICGPPASIVVAISATAIVIARLLGNVTEAGTSGLRVCGEQQHGRGEEGVGRGVGRDSFAIRHSSFAIDARREQPERRTSAVVITRAGSKEPAYNYRSSSWIFWR